MLLALSFLSIEIQQYLRVLRHTHVLFKPGIYDINSFAITISFIACISQQKYAMVTDGNRETNMVAMVAVKANSVKPPYDRHTHITC